MLYLVATPIGNMEDISYRAVRVLSEVDYIAAEDTRELAKLLAFLGIKKRHFSYHHHNRQKALQRILTLLHEGKSIALVSDAGMPLISDPGAELVAKLHEEGLPLTVIPGASAGLAALVVSGLPCDRFVFEGFLPKSGAERKRRVLALQAEERVTIIYEAPHRLPATLHDLAQFLGANRHAVLVRELTKIHEEVISGELGELIAHYQTKEVRGEYVLLIAGVAGLCPPADTPEEAVQLYRQFISQGIERSTALKRAALQSGMGRDELYNLLVTDKKEFTP